VFLLPGICALAIAAIAFGLRVGKKGPLKERT